MSKCALKSACGGAIKCDPLVVPRAGDGSMAWTPSIPVYGCAVEFLTVDGARLAYRTMGSGPVLLAPECNYSWTPEFEALMSRNFTVVIASPRNFGASTRTAAPYDPKLWASDMLSVTQHLGHDSFSVFGYSFTGAFGPWLALKLKDHAKVEAVASGGFPLLGDYGITSRDVDAQMEELEKDEQL
jgi:pimeloyl-ACP methyl ester carboxylesterase